MNVRVFLREGYISDNYELFVLDDQNGPHYLVQEAGILLCRPFKESEVVGSEHGPKPLLVLPGNIGRAVFPLLAAELEKAHFEPDKVGELRGKLRAVEAHLLDMRVLAGLAPRAKGAVVR